MHFGETKGICDVYIQNVFALNGILINYKTGLISGKLTSVLSKCTVMHMETNKIILLNINCRDIFLILIAKNQKWRNCK